MSNASAVAAVTATLHRLIENGITQDVMSLPDPVSPRTEIRCTTLPLDLANEENRDRNRINLFLYQTQINAALRNMDIPNLKERGRPPLALNLYYLITAYGEDHNRYVDHFLLGRAMRVMHDLPFLPRNEINRTFKWSGLHEQMELAHITPQPLSVDDMSKIWTTFQTQYRISAAYEVSVVLIDSQERGSSPLPVLRRGSEDRGVDTLIGPFAQLSGLRPVFRPKDWSIPRSYAHLSAQLGDRIEIAGQYLGGEEVTVRFSHPLMPGEFVELATESESTATELLVNLPDGDETWSTWPAGFYTVQAIIRRQSEQTPFWTNRLAMAMAPKLDLQSVLNDQEPLMRDNFGHVTVRLTSRPDIFPGQLAMLLLNDQRVPAASHPGGPDKARFEISDAPAGEFQLLRLRVDGVDSSPIKHGGSELAFDPAQTFMFGPPTLIVDLTIQPLASGDAAYEVTTSWPVQKTQKAFLLLDGREISAQSRQNDQETETYKLKFIVKQPPAGEHTVQLRVGTTLSLPATWTGSELELNEDHEALLALTPLITKLEPESTDLNNGPVEVDVTCRVIVEPGQQATLKLNNLAIAAEIHGAPTQTLRFDLSQTPPGEYAARLELAGVDIKTYKQLKLKIGDQEREGLVLNPAHKLTIEKKKRD